MPWRLFIPIIVVLIFVIGVYYAIEVGQSLQVLVNYLISLLRQMLNILA